MGSATCDATCGGRAGVPGGVRYGYGGRSARGEKFLAIFSVNHCILALKVMPYR